MKKLILITALSALSALGHAAAAAPIIDVHLHSYSDNPLFGSRINNEMTGLDMVASADPESHLHDTREQLRQHNVVAAVVSGDPQSVQLWKHQLEIKVLQGVLLGNPDKIDIAFLRRQHEQGRLDVIAELAPQYAGVAADDKRLKPVFDLAEELDVPVGYHLYPGGAPGAAYREYPLLRAGLTNPFALEDVLLAHPKMRIYIMHAGWPMLDEMIALMYAHPQVYVDISTINWGIPRAEFHHYLKRLVNAGFGKRIMFGSDQMVWPDHIREGIESIESASFLTAEQKRDIFYNNAVRFFRLEDQVVKNPA